MLSRVKACISLQCVGGMLSISTCHKLHSFHRSGLLLWGNLKELCEHGPRHFMTTEKTTVKIFLLSNNFL